jgi:hypothetical protein
MSDVARGFTGHSLVGASYTYEQVEALRHKDLKEMEHHLTVGLEDEISDEEGNTGGPGDDPPHVSFGPTVNLGNLNKIPAPRTPMPTSSQLCNELVGRTRKGVETKQMWYGVINVAGACWIFGSLEKSQEYVDTKVFRYARVFERKSEAMEWKEGGANTPLDVKDNPSDPGDKTPSDLDVDSNNSGTDKPSQKGSKKPNKKDSQNSKKKSKKKRSKPKRRVRRNAPTPPSSSSKDSSSTSSKSDSSEDSKKRCN